MGQNKKKKQKSWQVKSIKEITTVYCDNLSFSIFIYLSYKMFQSFE